MLATVGVLWLSSGPAFVMPSGETVIWSGSRWWNQTANRAATAEEAAAARAAVLSKTTGRVQQLGRGSTANLAKGSTLARNLREQLAIEQALTNPSAGKN